MADEYILDADIEGETLSDKSSKVTAILATFFGTLGLHRFYTGYFLIGLIQLITCGGFVIWAIIDIISIYRNTYLDCHDRPLKDYNSGFIKCLVLFLVISLIVWFFIVSSFVRHIKKAFTSTEIKTPLNNVMLANDDSYVKNYFEDNTPEQEIPVPTDFEVVTKSGVNVVKSEFCQGNNGLKMICGSIVNTNKRIVRNVSIKFQLFDKNNKFVDFSSAKVYSIAPEAEWKFQAPVYYNTVENYKIFKVGSY